MTGRSIFKYVKRLLKILVLLLNVIPRFLKIFIWDAISPYSQLPFTGLRYVLLKNMAKECGDNVRIGKNVTIMGWRNLTIGENVSVHANCYIDATGGIEIGNNVSIAHNTSILSTDHTWDDTNLPIKYNPIIEKSVIVESDVWIGCGCRILGGVRIAKRSVVAAGGVLNKNTIANSIFGGVPAKKVKEI